MWGVSAGGGVCDGKDNGQERIKLTLGRIVRLIRTCPSSSVERAPRCGECLVAEICPVGQHSPMSQ